VSAFQKALDWLKTTRAWSAWQRYGNANGDLLAAGVAYFAFFSIFPALALAFAVFGFVLQGHPELLDTIAASLNKALPGMVKTADNPDGIISLTAPASLTLTVTGIIAFVTLLLAGLGWVGALRTGIRTVFGLKASTGNAVTTRLRDLGVLAVLGLLIAVSAILSSSIGGLAGTIADWVGLPGGAVLVGLAGLLAGVVFDTLIMVVLLRLLTGAPLPWRNVRHGALLGGAIITVLKLFGGFLISHATGNPLLSAVAIPVGLLFWLNLMSRIVLLASSWAAGDVDLATLSDETRRTALATARRPRFLAPLPATADTSLLPYAAGPPVPAALTSLPASSHTAGRRAAGSASGGAGSSRAVDRVSVAAGVVAGAAGATAVAAWRGLRRR
jgi:membrane protein